MKSTPFKDKYVEVEQARWGVSNPLELFTLQLSRDCFSTFLAGFCSRVRGASLPHPERSSRKRTDPAHSGTCVGPSFKGKLARRERSLGLLAEGQPKAGAQPSLQWQRVPEAPGAAIEKALCCVSQPNGSSPPPPCYRKHSVAA